MTRPVSIRLKISLIILASFAVYLAGNGRVSLWDRDEPRYAQTSRQMYQSGDWVVPHLLDKVRTAKPIFIYWCQALAMKVFGDDEFAARFPSSVAMMLTLVVISIAVYRWVGHRRAMWTVFILGTSGLAIAAAKMCLTDAVLLLFITTAQICLALLYTKRLPPLPPGEGRGEGASEFQAAQAKPNPLTLTLSRGERGQRQQLAIAALMWIAIGFAGLTKGPVVLGICFTTMLALAILDRRIAWWKLTRPILGILIVAIICAPWLILIHHREPTFLPTILGHDVLERARSGLEGHKGPPGFYLLLIWVTYFPWSLLLPAAIVHAWRRRHLPIIRFSLAAIIGPWIMFEIVQTKLPHYILPTFPFLAFLTADMLICAARKRIPSKAFTNIVAGWGIIMIAVACAPWLSMRMFRPYINSAAVWSMFILTLIAIEYARQVYVYTRANRPLDAAAVMGIGMLLIVLVMYVGYLPNAQFLRTSQRVADVLHYYDGKNAIMIDYKEDSLPWCEGGTIRGQRDNDFLLHNPPGSWPKFIVLTGEVWRRTPFYIQRQFDILDGHPIRGLAYSDGGRVVDVFVLRKKSE
jgi:4-amino-4-deoxy-L-arabinose transferase-like glycosyltransferase